MNAGSSQKPVSPLSGRRILIVEDEMLIALNLSDIVESMGCTSAMAARVEKAVSLAATETFDAAILDLNLDGKAVYPVAEELCRRRVPFVLATGYGAEGIAAAYRDRPILTKPYSNADVERTLLRALEVKTK
jgi:DNA-binding response OmpR family regulator